MHIGYNYSIKLCIYSLESIIDPRGTTEKGTITKPSATSPPPSEPLIINTQCSKGTNVLFVL